MTLAELGASNGANKPAGVFRWYEGLFAPYHKKSFPADSNGKLDLLEIGIKEGHSLRTWDDYFGPDMLIHGLDLDITQLQGMQSPRVRVGKVDQGSRESLEEATKGCSYDIIIDDGSHWCSHQQLTLGYLFPKLKPGGIYIIEDLHTSQWDNPSAKAFHVGCVDHRDVTTNFIWNLARREYKSRFVLDKELSYLEQNILDVAEMGCCFHKSGYRRNWGVSQQACIWKRG